MKVLTLLASIAAILGTPRSGRTDPDRHRHPIQLRLGHGRGCGWEQTEATVEIAIPPSEGGEGLEDFAAGPVQVFPDTQGNIPATTLQFTKPPPDGDYVAVVLVDSIARDQSAGFALAGCTEKTLPRTGSLRIPMLATGLVLAAIGFGSCEGHEPTSTASTSPFTSAVSSAPEFTPIRRHHRLLTIGGAQDERSPDADVGIAPLPHRPYRARTDPPRRPTPCLYSGWTPVLIWPFQRITSDRTFEPGRPRTPWWAQRGHTKQLRAALRRWAGHRDAAPGSTIPMQRERNVPEPFKREHRADRPHVVAGERDHPLQGRVAGGPGWGRCSTPTRPSEESAAHAPSSRRFGCGQRPTGRWAMSRRWR